MSLSVRAVLGACAFMTAVCCMIAFSHTNETLQPISARIVAFYPQPENGAHDDAVDGADDEAGNTGDLYRNSLRNLSESMPMQWLDASLSSNNDLYFVPLQGGHSGRMLLLSEWTLVTDQQRRRKWLPPMAVVESMMALCEDGTQIIVGGYTPSYTEMFSILQVFPPEGSWYQVKTPKGFQESHNGVTCHGGAVYVVSGQLGPGCSGPSTSVFVYHLDDQAWTTLPNIPAGRYVPGVAVVGNSLHVFGGAAEDRRTKAQSHWSLDLSDPSAGWQEEESMPSNSSGSHSLIFTPRDGSALYLCASLFGDAKAVTEAHDIAKDCHHLPTAYTDDQCFKYDVELKQWTALQSRVPKAAAHTATVDVVSEDFVLTMGGSVGGVTPTMDRSVTRMFDKTTDSWHLGPDFPARSKGDLALQGAGEYFVFVVPFVSRSTRIKDQYSVQSLYRMQATIAEPLEPIGEGSRVQVLRVPTVGYGRMLDGAVGETLWTSDIVTPIVLNLADRPDRLRMVIDETRRLQWECILRFDAAHFSFEDAKEVGIIDWDAFDRNFKHARKGADTWFKRWVKADNQKLFKAHVGNKFSMTEMFRMGAAVQDEIEPLLHRAGCRRPSTAAAVRPLLILEDDASFLHVNETLLADALKELETVPGGWHLLYIAYRDEEDWRPQPPGLKHVIRLKGVLSNTAMVVNPAVAQTLVAAMWQYTEGPDALLDHLILSRLQEETLVAYRLKQRMVAPVKSMSSIHETELEYKDTIK